MTQRLSPIEADFAAIAPVHNDQVDAVLNVLRAYLVIEDWTHVAANLAVSATRNDGGNPLWLLTVGSPSASKTETLRALADVADGHLDEVTCAGLLSWTKGKAPKPTGLLTRIPTNAFATIGDLSTLLAGSNKGLRDETYAALRRVYDGSYTRNLGNAPDALRWEGRLTLAAAVTPAVDHYSSHEAALGSRWLYVRMPELLADGKRHAAEVAMEYASRLDEFRGHAREAASQAVTLARTFIQHDKAWESGIARHRIADAAMVAAVGRSVVPRSGYGAREIDGDPIVEEPMRLATQLILLHRGLLAMGMRDLEALRVTQRCALHSMPEIRRNVLGQLALGEPLTAAEIARRTGSERKVARFALEELYLLGVVVYDGHEHDDDEDSRRQKHWQLRGDHAQRVTAIFNSDRALSGTKSASPTHQTHQ